MPPSRPRSPSLRHTLRNRRAEPRRRSNSGALENGRTYLIVTPPRHPRCITGNIHIFHSLWDAGQKAFRSLENSKRQQRNLFLAPSAECQPTRSLHQHGPRIKFIAFPDLAQGQMPLHNSEDLEQPINDYIRQPWTAAWSSKGLFSIPRENTTYPSSSATSCPTLSSLHNPQCGGRKIAASHPCYSRSQGPRPHSLHFRPQNRRKPRQLHLCPPTTSVGRMELLPEPHLQQRQGEVRQLIFDVGAFVDGYHLGAPDNLGLVC